MPWVTTTRSSSERDTTGWSPRAISPRPAARSWFWNGAHRRRRRRHRGDLPRLQGLERGRRQRLSLGRRTTRSQAGFPRRDDRFGSGRLQPATRRLPADDLPRYREDRSGDRALLEGRCRGLPGIHRAHASPGGRRGRTGTHDSDGSPRSDLRRPAWSGPTARPGTQARPQANLGAAAHPADARRGHPERVLRIGCGEGAIGANSSLGVSFGPQESGTAYTMLHSWALSGNGLFRSAGVVKGGMGALCDAIATAARGFGAEIRTDAPVASITVEDGRATGVELESGEELAANTVVSNADPRTTFNRLLDPRTFWGRSSCSTWRTSSTRARGCASISR